MNRNEAREQAFLFVFNECFNAEQSVPEIIATATEASNYVEDAYSRKLLDGVKAHKEELDEVIESKLKKWRLSRLPKTTLAILRIACFEILYCEDVPDSVAINEAVELAKKFGSENDYVFINGVLGNIARSKS